MSEIVSPEVPPVLDHDHAWRHVKGDPAYGSSWEYRCDVCDLSWSL